MQIDDHPLPEKPSKINDPYLQKLIEVGRHPDSMEFVKVPKIEPPMDTWFIDSSGAPHRVQDVSPWIPLDLRLLLTIIQPDTSCRIKCFNLGGHVLSSVAFDIAFFELSDTCQIVFKKFCRFFFGNYSACILYVMTHWTKPHSFSTNFMKHNSCCMIRRSRNQSLFLGTPRDRGSTNCKKHSQFAIELYIFIIEIIN